jgi:hypothetical protein
LLIVSPDSTGTACPLSGRNSTYRPVQISGAGSQFIKANKRETIRASKELIFPRAGTILVMTRQCRIRGTRIKGGRCVMTAKNPRS